jgi:oligosaccharide repeat unit polymerase
MESKWLVLVLFLMVVTVAAYIGRVWFKRWFNPLSIYSAIWGFCLGNYELRLIQYEQISAQAWAYIEIAWVCLFLGAATVLCMQDCPRQRTTRVVPIDLKYLKRVIIILSVVASIGVADQIRVAIREFGGIFGTLFANAGELYLSRSSAELSNIPYASSFAFAACGLAGVYTAILGRFTLLALIPPILITVMNIFAMGRLGLAIAAVLFMSGYVHTPRQTRLKLASWQRIFALTLGGVILAGGYVLVSSTRGLGVDFPGKTSAMNRIEEYIPVFPSVYSSVSASPVAFSMYLASPEERKVESWGQYTFAPVLRLLSKLGFPTYVERLEESYYTPVPSNICTYLKDVHSDFGLVGILFFPYFLGTTMTILTYRIERRPRLVDLALLSNLYVIVVFSFAFNLMFLGDWYISVAVSTVAAYLVERKTGAAHAPLRSISGPPEAPLAD